MKFFISFLILCFTFNTFAIPDCRKSFESSSDKKKNYQLTKKYVKDSSTKGAKQGDSNQVKLNYTHDRPWLEAEKQVREALNFLIGIPD